jgi:integrase
MMARPRGTGRVFTRGGSRWIAYCHRGEERRESVAVALGMLPSQVKVTDAWNLLKKRLAEMEDGRYVAHQDRVVFGDLLDGLVIDYTNNGRRSVDTLTAHIKPVRAAFGLDRAVDVTEARVERYKDARLHAQRKPATVNRELAVIRRAFRLAVRQKRLAAMPAIVLLAEHNARQGFFERGDFETLCGYLPEHLRDFARFAYLSGWRKGEVASLTWADVDRDSCRRKDKLASARRQFDHTDGMTASHQVGGQVQIGDGIHQFHLGSRPSVGC